MILLSWLLLFFVQAAKADYLSIGWTFLNEPEIYNSTDSADRVPFKSVCDQMKYNYLEETQRLKKLNEELAAAVNQPLTDDQLNYIRHLKNEIHQCTDRLTFLAKPEWNSETISYKIRWWLPEDYSRNFRKIINFNIKSAYFKGEPAGHVARNLRKITNYEPVVPRHKKDWRYIDYDSAGTYLEVCQFIQTLQFEVDVLFFFVELPTRLPVPHSFFLKGRAP